MVHCHSVLRSVHSLGHLQCTHITLPSIVGKLPRFCEKEKETENHFSWAVFEDV
jgi:hypothetical protein